MSTLTAEQQTLKVTRRFKAPRERVFAAFTTAEAIQKWFGCGPPHIIECTSDFRVGGGYRFSNRLAVKVEYSLERGTELDGGHRNHEDFFGTEAVFKF